MSQQVIISVKYAFLLIAFVALIILFSPYLLPPDMLLSISGFFQTSNRVDPVCPLCGMTRAFIAISQGDFDKAMTLNYWSVMLYGILIFVVFSAISIVTRDMSKLCFLQVQKIKLYNSQRFL